MDKAQRRADPNRHDPYYNPPKQCNIRVIEDACEQYRHVYFSLTLTNSIRKDFPWNMHMIGWSSSGSFCCDAYWMHSQYNHFLKFCWLWTRNQEMPAKNIWCISNAYPAAWQLNNISKSFKPIDFYHFNPIIHKGHPLA